MAKQILLTKEKKVYLQLLNDSSTLIHVYLSKIGKNIKWLRFAKYTANEYAYIDNKDQQWKMIAKVIQNITEKYPIYTTDYIFNLLREHIHSSIAEYMKDKNVWNQEDYLPSEKKYIAKSLIEVVTNPCHIPNYPWIMPIKQVNTMSWQAKNLSTKKINEIIKKEADNWYEYYIQ